jgi:hypothetical protein
MRSPFGLNSPFGSWHSGQSVLGRYRAPSGATPTYVVDAARDTYAVNLSGWAEPYRVAGTLPTLFTGFDIDTYGSGVGSTLQRKNFADVITFTRAGSKTGVLSSGLIGTFGTDVPAFVHDPLSLARRGLLVEASRTNSVLHNRAMATAPWDTSVARGTVTSGGAVGIDGVAGSATLWIENTDTNPRSIVQGGISATSGTQYVASAFVRRTGPQGRFPALALESATVFGETITGGFDLATGAVVTQGTGTNVAAGVDQLSGGWWRIWVTAQAVVSANFGYRLRMRPTATGGSYTGDGLSGFAVDFAQVEVGSRPTSPIFTTSAAITRAADSAVAATAGWLAAGQGTLIAVGRRLRGAQAGLCVLTDGTANNRLTIQQQADGRGLSTVRSGGVNVAQVANVGAPPAEGAPFAIAASYAANILRVSMNGSSVGTTGATFSVPPLSSLRIGAILANFFEWNGTISRALYFPTPLPDADIQAITAALAAGG